MIKAHPTEIGCQGKPTSTPPLGRLTGRTSRRIGGQPTCCRCSSASFVSRFCGWVPPSSDPAGQPSPSAGDGGGQSDRGAGGGGGANGLDRSGLVDGIGAAKGGRGASRDRTRRGVELDAVGVVVVWVALLDLGCYCISAIRLFGGQPLGPIAAVELEVPAPAQPGVGKRELVGAAAASRSRWPG
jgi:hypothetical protein